MRGVLANDVRRPAKTAVFSVSAVPQQRVLDRSEYAGRVWARSDTRLLEADVNYNVVQEFMEKVTDDGRRHRS